MGKVTKHLLPYPIGYKPDFIVPADYSEYRFAIGKMGANPLVTICMNPSAARDDSSDRTINRIITVSNSLEMDGWVVFNIYPERATDAKNIEQYDEALSAHNVQVIQNFLTEHKIAEIWGAWGDDKNNNSLRNGKQDLLSMLDSAGIPVFYFGTLTKDNNPRHPLQRQEKINYTNEDKHYLKIAQP